MSDLEKIKKHYESLLPKDVSNEINERVDKLKDKVEKQESDIKNSLSSLDDDFVFVLS